MSVEVQIPLSVRLDAVRPGQAPAPELRAACTAAMARALAEMDSELIAPAGGYSWPSFNTPVFDWSASPTPSADVQSGLEREISQSIQTAINSTQFSHAARLEAAPEPIPDNPSELFDAGRLASASHYFLPSYNTNPPEPDVAVPVDFLRKAGLTETHFLAVWQYDGGSVRATVSRFLAEHVKPTPGSTTAVLFGSGSAYIIAFLHIDSVTSSRVSFSVLNTYEFQAQFVAIDEEGNHKSTGLGQGRSLTLRKIRDITGRAAYKKVVLEHIYAGLPRPMPAPGGTLSKEDAQIERFAEERLPQDCPPMTAATLNGTLMTIPQNLFPGPSVEIYPLYAVHAKSDTEDGQGGGGGASKWKGPGQSQGSGGQGGSPLADPDKKDEAAKGPARIYPVVAGGRSVELDLGPFLGEPSLEELGQYGERLRPLMEQIAFRLEMPMTEYPGSFCIAAARVIGMRAGTVGAYSGQNKHTTIVPAAAPGSGNLGDIHMPPSTSPAIEVIRFLCATDPLLNRLQLALNAIMDIPTNNALISGYRQGDPVGWSLDFYKAFTPAIKDSSAEIFRRTCQIKMLELLRHSELEINKRREGFPSYYRKVAALVDNFVSSEAELRLLRDKLKDKISDEEGLSFNDVVAVSYQTWREGRQAFLGSLSDKDLNKAALTLTVEHGDISKDGSTWKIADKRGRRWSLAELEQAIAFRHKVAAADDPLINQFRDIPEVVAMFSQHPNGAKDYLIHLLDEMAQNNEQMRKKVVSDSRFAFRAGKLREDLKGRTVPHTSYALQGIHLVAHEAISDAFGGSNSYALGLEYALDVEAGFKGLIVFTETVGVLLLSVACPPLGAAVGIAIAGAEYYHADQISTLYGSLINPEEILKKSEVEFDLFLAEFGFALSLIPEAGPILKAGAKGARTLAKSGVRKGVKVIARDSRKALIKASAEKMKNGVAEALLKEIVTDRVLNLVLPHVLGPVFAEINREITIIAGERPAPRPVPKPAKPARLKPAPGEPGADQPKGMNLSEQDLARLPQTPDEHRIIRKIEEYEDTFDPANIVNPADHPDTDDSDDPEGGGA